MQATAEKVIRMTEARVGRVLSWGDTANPRRVGVVVRVSEPENPTYMLGTGTMRPVAARIKVVFQDLHVHEVPDSIVNGNAWRWEDRADLSAEACADLERHARGKMDEQREVRERKQADRNEAEAAFKARLAELKPEWAKSCLVAVRDVDDCDTMTDYFNHTSTDRVVLAWSKHTRDIFSEMRKAARTFEKTADLAEAGKEAEHREKYSMGGGYYLKDGYRHSNGWRVEKTGFAYLFPADLSPVS